MTALVQPAPARAPASPTGGERDHLRHELVDAQVQVLNMYLDKRSAEEMVDALDRLIACCQASFAAEEGLMLRLRGQADPVHRDRHQAVLDRLEQLRFTVLDTDRGRLLANLILVDRELIAHVADERKAGNAERQVRPPAANPVPH